VSYREEPGSKETQDFDKFPIPTHGPIGIQTAFTNYCCDIYFSTFLFIIKIPVRVGPITQHAKQNPDFIAVAPSAEFQFF
jgi:hypothetical protein